MKAFTETPYEQTNMVSYMLTDAWRPDNPNATIAQLGGDRQNNYARASNAYIEDGSFLRFKNISIGYTLPKTVSRKIGMEKLRFYAALQNYFTITKYSGRDPELGSTWGVFVQKADLGNYTMPKTMNFDAFNFFCPIRPKFFKIICFVNFLYSLLEIFITFN